MTSNYKKIFAIVLSVVTLATSGCGKYLNGEKAKGEVIELGDAKFKCLKALPETLKNLSVGESDPEEIREGADCINNALTYFQRRTDGSLNGGDYTTADMRKFFSKYFLKENKVSPQFADELMKIKKALLGGSDQFMTKDEVLKLVDLMKVIREELVLIAPHIKVLLKQDPKVKANWDEVATATEQLRRSLQKILSVSQLSKSDYSLEDAKRAFSGLSEFIRGSQPFMPYERYSRWIPLVESVKNVLMGRSPHFSGMQDWSQGLDNLIDLYSLALKYAYVIRDNQLESPSDARQLTQFAMQFLDLVESSHQMASTGQIPFADIDNLISEISRYVDMKGVRPDSIKTAYQVFILKVLEPQRQGDSRGLFGVERKHIAALKRELNVFRMTQSFVDSLYTKDPRVLRSQQHVLAAYKEFDFAYVIDKGLSADPLERQALRVAWKDFGNLLESKFPVNFSAKGGMFIASEPGKYSMTWKALTKFNIMKAITRILMLGYGTQTKGELSKSEISKDSLIAWYSDFQEIGYDLKAFDRRTGNSGGRSFLEANFFTPSGDGQNGMNDRESFEFVSLLFSAGLGTSSKIQADMTVKGCAQRNVDVFGKPFMDEACFKRVLRENFVEYFDNLPDMSMWVRYLSDEAFDQFFAGMVDAARISPADGGYIETADLRTMVTMLHYTETVMAIYDLDHSNGLSIAEIKAANPRFLPFFRAQNLTKYEYILDESFTYLVLEGDIPTGVDLVEHLGTRFIDYVKSSLRLGEKHPEASRASIFKILKTLKVFLAKQQAEAAAKAALEASAKSAQDAKN
jgi:hypothetical protein